MENGDIPEDANERMNILIIMCLNFAMFLYIRLTLILVFFVFWHLQIAQVLSLILLENLMHVKVAQISKFVPLLLKDLTLVGTLHLYLMLLCLFPITFNYNKKFILNRLSCRCLYISYFDNKR